MVFFALLIKQFLKHLHNLHHQTLHQVFFWLELIKFLIFCISFLIHQYNSFNLAYLWHLIRPIQGLLILYEACLLFRIKFCLNLLIIEPHPPFLKCHLVRFSIQVKWWLLIQQLSLLFTLLHSFLLYLLLNPSSDKVFICINLNLVQNYQWVVEFPRWFALKSLLPYTLVL